MTIVEAFASGLPVVASRLGAMQELIADGSNGLFFEPGDARSLAERVRWLVDHEPDRARLASGAHATYLERFQPEANYARLVEIYRHAVARRRGLRAEGITETAAAGTVGSSTP
jgi:glycosyltransferase involved in cell wall biosynthesis